MSGQAENTGTTELTDRLGAAANELSGLYRDLYWLVQGQNSPQQQQTLQDLDFDQIMELKLAVDNLRDMLWKYIDAASVADAGKVREATEVNNLRRVTRLLQLLREGLGRAPESPPLSFIERVSAAIQEKLDGSGGRAA